MRSPETWDKGETEEKKRERASWTWGTFAGDRTRPSPVESVMNNVPGPEFMATFGNCRLWPGEEDLVVPHKVFGLGEFGSFCYDSSF